jgi:hypothetical protein
MAHIRWRVDCVSYHSQAHCSWVAVMVAFCLLFFISFFSLISYAGPDSQTTLYTEFESIDWLLIANWIRKECACLGWEAGALKLHWLHTNVSDGWQLFSGSILNVHLYLRECQVVHIIHPRSWKAWYREYEGLKLQMALNSFRFSCWELHFMLCLLKVNVHGSVHRKKIPIYIQQDATLHSLFISGNCSACFGWYLHPSSGAHTISTAPGIFHTVTTTCGYMQVLDVSGYSLEVVIIFLFTSHFRQKLVNFELAVIVK